ncbi:MAG: hypothetical protein ACYSTZ_01170 [Planctomycetota bacterium]
MPVEELLDCALIQSCEVIIIYSRNNVRTNFRKLLVPCDILK